MKFNKARVSNSLTLQRRYTMHVGNSDFKKRENRVWAVEREGGRYHNCLLSDTVESMLVINDV